MLTSHHNLPPEPLMAYQLRQRRGACRPANFRRGGCPGFRVPRQPRPPSSLIFSDFSKPLWCPALWPRAEKIAARTAGVGQGCGA